MIGGMDPAKAVQLFRVKERRIEAMRALVGGINASDLRRLSVSDEIRDALIRGVSDPYPPVRFGCLGLLDHLPDPSVVPAICVALDDPVPRLRRLAAHSLGCGLCKPSWDGALPPEAVSKLADMASSDDNAKVRAEARSALASWKQRAHAPGEPLPGHVDQSGRWVEARQRRALDRSEMTPSGRT